MMIEPKIDKGIPPPRGTGRRLNWRKLLQRMSPGDSVAFPAEQHSHSQVSQAAFRFKTRHAPKTAWATRTRTEDGGARVVRIWRLE